MRVSNRCLRLAIAVAFVAMSMDVAAASVSAHEAKNKALQFLKSRSRTTLSISPQQLKLVHAEKSQADVRFNDY